jgi:hypothetical protein
MRAWLIVVVLSVLLLSVATAGASADPYRDQAARVPCPAAPPGWFNPPASEGGRTVLTPLTAISAPDGLTELSAAPAVEIDCDYRTTSGKDVQVRVRYALPIDLNPWNDFDIGCTVTGHPQAVSTAAQAWTDRARVYRVVGAKSWSLATFIDDLGQLDNADVPHFEAMTNAMLEAVQPFAHNCGLPGNSGPVDVRSIWTFSFDVRTTSGGVTSRGSATGSFVTTPSPTGGPGAISNLLATNFHLVIASGGTTHWLALHVGAPIEFRHGYGSLLRAQVSVIDSTAAGCRTGSTGTLLVSVPYLTPPLVSVSVCGHTYLDGKGRVRAAIKTV